MKISILTRKSKQEKTFLSRFALNLLEDKKATVLQLQHNDFVSVKISIYIKLNFQQKGGKKIKL